MERKYIDELVRLIDIPTIFDEKQEAGGPFGENVKKGLEEVLRFGKTLGFSVKNYDGYAGELTMGSGDYIIGILCHIDVVAAGSGWTDDPFCGRVEAGKVYGRGSSDDKGPLIAAMSAIVQLNEKGLIPPDVSVRMIIGTNEEEAWGGINYYVKKAERLPDVSLVPDGAFPVIFCEKGLLDIDLSWNGKKNSDGQVHLRSISGGEGRNVVAPLAEAVLACETDADAVRNELERIICKKNYNGKVKMNQSDLVVTVKGASAHAMTPEKGINAVSQLIDVLHEAVGSDCDYGSFLEDYMNAVGLDFNGAKGGFFFEDEESGKLTYNTGMIEMTRQGDLKILANIRYPASRDYNEVMGCIRDGLETKHFDVFEADFLPPVSFRKDSPLIETLMAAYREETGDYNSQPISMGGATYARAIPNAVSFGMLFPDEEELAHGPNEFISIESMETGERIYINALQKLIEKRL